MFDYFFTTVMNIGVLQARPFVTGLCLNPICKQDWSPPEWSPLLGVFVYGTKTILIMILPIITILITLNTADSTKMTLLVTDILYNLFIPKNDFNYNSN